MNGMVNLAAAGVIFMYIVYIYIYYIIIYTHTYIYIYIVIYYIYNRGILTPISWDTGPHN